MRLKNASVSATARCALAEAVLEVLQKLDARSGDKFSSLAAIKKGVRERLSWAEYIDVDMC